MHQITHVKENFFFHKIQKWIINYSQNKEEIIVGGDLNFTEFNNLDRKKYYFYCL